MESLLSISRAWGGMKGSGYEGGTFVGVEGDELYGN